MTAADGAVSRARASTPTWTTPAVVAARIAASLDSGALLREPVDAPSRFPWRLPLRGPGARDLLEDLPRVREWVGAWERAATGPGLALEWKPVGGRAVGASDVPAALTVATLDAAARLARRNDLVAAFRSARGLVAARRPALAPWVEAHPAQAAALVREGVPPGADPASASTLGRLLTVVDWFEAHPACGLYLRQVDVPGVGTKFLEEHRAVVAQLLDVALPGAVVDASATGLRGFARRFGLRDADDRLVRIRVLDRALEPWPGAAELALAPAALAGLPRRARLVVVTENKVNLLCLPPMPGTIALFGAGYGFAALREVAWLRETPVLYWGDIDTHGFAILAQLRAEGIDARSVLMDLETLLAHRDQWVQEETPTAAALDRLDDAEAALYRELVDHRLGVRVRLEQERVAFGWARTRLLAAAAATGAAAQP